MFNRRRLFVASCASLVANAMAASLCTDIMGDFARDFELTKAQVGFATSAGAIIGAAAMLVGGAMLDFLGIGTALWIAFASHLCGLTLIIFARDFWMLLGGWVFMSLASSAVEAAINPLAATVYSDRKTHILNVLHAWWPGGLVIGGLLGYSLTKLLGLDLKTTSPEALRFGWQIKMALVYLPVLFYGVLIFGQKFPKTERVQAGVSTATMFREALRPMFLLLLFCMFLTASTELAPGRWVGVFIKDIINVQGILFLVYTSALMFVLRFFAGPIARFLSPFGLLVISSVLSFVGLLALSYSTTLVTVIISETIFGLGVTYFWPTMLGVTSERFPKGGAFLLGVIGAAGGLFLSYVAVPTMGKIDDHYALKGLPQAVQEKVVVGGRVDDKLIRALPEAERAVIDEQVDAAEKHAASLTFRWVAIMPVILILVFGVLWLRDVMAGGYKEERLTRAAP